MKGRIIANENHVHPNMNRKQKLDRLFDLPDSESYEEYLKLSPNEQREYEDLVRARAEHFEKLTMEARVRAKELEEELKRKDEEIKCLEELLRSREESTTADIKK